MFRTLIYPSSGACDCFVELPHLFFCSRFVVCWRFGAAGFEWCPCCRLKLATWLGKFRTSVRIGEKGNSHRRLVEKLGDRRTMRGPRRRWKDSIKTHVKEIKW